MAPGFSRAGVSQVLVALNAGRAGDFQVVIAADPADESVFQVLVDFQVVIAADLGYASVFQVLGALMLAMPAVRELPVGESFLPPGTRVPYFLSAPMPQMLPLISF